MFKKGRKREAKGLAVLYFIIGLIILFIILAVIYFARAKLDYSDKLDPDATTRPYVEQEVDSVLPDEGGEDLSEYDLPEDDVDLTAETPEPTEAPTPEPTAEPTPAPTPEPTPEPTPLPTDKVAKPMKKALKIPDSASENGKIGITSCFTSPADDNKLMYLAGYGYVNEEAYDGTNARIWMIVTQEATGQSIAYPMIMTPEISGLPHSDAVCKNATASDFETVLDVSQYKEGIYYMALVVGYVPSGAKDVTYRYYPFSNDISFTVLNGQIVTPVAASLAD